MRFIDAIAKYWKVYIYVFLAIIFAGLASTIYNYKSKNNSIQYTEGLERINNCMGKKNTSDLFREVEKTKKFVSGQTGRYHFLFLQYESFAKVGESATRRLGCVKTLFKEQLEFVTKVGNDMDKKVFQKLNDLRKEIKQIKYVSAGEQYSDEIAFGFNVSRFSMVGQLLLYYKCLFHFEDGEYAEANNMHSERCMDAMKDIRYIALRAKVIEKLQGKRAKEEMIFKEFMYGRYDQQTKLMLESLFE